MKDHIRPPVKVDAKGRVVADQQVRAHRWRLNVPASITGTKKQRLFFKTEGEAKKQGASLIQARLGAGRDLLERLRSRGMSVADAIEYALKHAPTKISVDINHACEAYLDSKREGNSKVRYLAGLKSQFSHFQADFGKRTVDSISKDELQKFIRDLTAKDGDTPAAPKTRINFIITLKALFNFAVSEGWRGENPAAQIPRPKLDEVTIEILADPSRCRHSSANCGAG